jgi:hypothetical protein
MQNRRYSRRLVSLSTNSPGTGCVAALRPIAPDAQLEATDDKPTAPGHYAAPPRLPPPPWTPQPPGIPPLFGTPRGAGALLGGSCGSVRPSLALRATCPDPLRDIIFAPGAYVNTTPRGLRIYRQAWLAQTTKARPPDMPGFTPEPPGSQQSFALQHKPQSERPLLRGSTPTTCQFNYNTTNIYYNSNTSINIIRPHPATLAPGGFRRARNALKAPWYPEPGFALPRRRNRAARADLILALRFAALSGCVCPRRMRGLAGVPTRSGNRAERALLHPHGRSLR